MKLDRRTFFAALLASPLARFLPKPKLTPASELAEGSGLTIRMIRQYDKVGLAFHRDAFLMMPITFPLPPKRHRTRDEARRARAAAAAARQTLRQS